MASAAGARYGGHSQVVVQPRDKGVRLEEESPVSRLARKRYGEREAVPSRYEVSIRLECVHGQVAEIRAEGDSRAYREAALEGELRSANGVERSVSVPRCSPVVRFDIEREALFLVVWSECVYQARHELLPGLALRGILIADLLRTIHRSLLTSGSSVQEGLHAATPDRIHVVKLPANEHSLRSGVVHSEVLLQPGATHAEILSDRDGTDF